MARLVRRPLMQRLMQWAIQLVVPRHRIGVAVVALDADDRVLMLRHVFHPQAPWGLPGGWLGRHEAPAEGALREVVEETGLTAALGPPVYVVGEAHPHHAGIVYVAEVVAGELRLSPEILEAAWFPVDQLPRPLLKSVREAILAGAAYRRLTRQFEQGPA